MSAGRVVGGWARDRGVAPEDNEVPLITLLPDDSLGAWVPGASVAGVVGDDEVVVDDPDPLPLCRPSFGRRWPARSDFARSTRIRDPSSRALTKRNGCPVSGSISTRKSSGVPSPPFRASSARSDKHPLATAAPEAPSTPPPSRYIPA